MNMATGSILSNISGVDQNTPYWPVYALANGTVSYRDNGLSQRGREYNFMDLFYVLEEYPDVVRVVEGSYVISYRLTGDWQNNTCYFPKSSLMLWNQCLVDSVLVDNFPAVFNSKGMVVNNLLGSNFTGRPGYYPQPSSSSDMIEKLGLFKVQYIYYYTDKFILLGIFHQISNPAMVRSSIKGWVGKGIVQIWNHHLVLESDWTAGLSRRSNNTPIKIFESQNITGYSSNALWTPPPGSGSAIETESPYYIARKNGFIQKYPLISDAMDLTTDRPKVGCVGDINITEGIIPKTCIPTNITNESYNDIERKVMNGYAQWHQVNIIFVVDATASMEQYMNPIQMALTRTMANIIANNVDPAITYKFGAVIYRDCPEQDLKIQVFNGGSLSNDVQLLSNFFGETMIQDNNRFDRDQPEAVYLGIHEGINRYPIDPLNTNYLILIGDAGNLTKDCNPYTRNQIIDELAAKNFNLLFYQMHDKQSAENTYQTFRDDCESILKNVAAKRNEKLNKLYTDFLPYCSSITNSDFGRRLAGIPTTAGQINFVQDPFNPKVKEIDRFQCPLIGRFMPSPQLDSIRGHQLRQELDTALTKIAKESVLINNKMTSQSTVDRTLKTISMLMEFGLSLNEIVIYLSDKTQIYQEGYTIYNPDWNSKKPIFKYVVFINNPKVTAIHDFFEATIRPNQNPEADGLKTYIYNVWREIFINQLSQIPNISELNSTPIGRVLTYMTGLPSPEIYLDYQVSDLFVQGRFPDSLLYKLSVDFILANGHLRSLSEGKNELTYEYFRSYRFYILRFLRANNITLTNPDQFLKDLSSEYIRYGSNYGITAQGLPVYPNYNPDETHPKNKNNWYYFVDAEVFPSRIFNSSGQLLSKARNGNY
jgi:hypothetical protein